jgi:hypothetical protein
MSFIPENNREAFGDYTCKGGHLEITKNDHSYWSGCSIHEEPSEHWGFRHWIWMTAGLTFAIWNCVEVVDLLNKKNKP